MDSYFEEKKKNGLIFTLKNIDPSKPDISMYGGYGGSSLHPVTEPVGPLYWSKKSGRYRTRKEQDDFVRSGCVDKALPAIS